jgi:SprT protein
MTEEKIKAILQKYLPPQAVGQVAAWVVQHKVHLKITARRRTLLGNYRAPFNGSGHQISVNGDLNPYAFLLTFTHELAHLVTWEGYGRRAQPHGAEWKAAFRQLMQGFLAQVVFPADVAQALERYLADPAASSCRDQRLARVLRTYDRVATLHLEEIAPDGLFQIEDGRIFRKGEKLRKNYLCLEQRTHRRYKINALFPVVPVGEAAPQPNS